MATEKIKPSGISRRHLIVGSALGTLALNMMVRSASAANHLTRILDDNDVHPFKIAIPESDLADLRYRLIRTRWPDKETVADSSQGLQLEKLKSLISYWSSGYDWRKIESHLNNLPQFRDKN